MVRWMIIAALALAGLAIPVLVIAGYLFLLTVVAKRLPPLDGDPPSVRFDIIVPAHDEPSIASTVENLLAVDYPKDLRRVIVVADSCEGECLVQGKCCQGLNDEGKWRNDCLWEHLAPDEPPPDQK